MLNLLQISSYKLDWWFKCYKFVVKWVINKNVIIFEKFAMATGQKNNQNFRRVNKKIIFKSAQNFK